MHNVLLLGSPGAGTSMLARRLATILPDLTLAETIEAARIHHVAGLTGRHTAVVTIRPCRAPHHPIADLGLIGGGQIPRPGEGSRAHHGLLCLDKLPECTRHGLEVWRQPLKEGSRSAPPPERPASRCVGGHRRTAEDCQGGQ